MSVYTDYAAKLQEQAVEQGAAPLTVRLGADHARRQHFLQLPDSRKKARPEGLHHEEAAVLRQGDQRCGLRRIDRKGLFAQHMLVRPCRVDGHRRGPAARGGRPTQGGPRRAQPYDDAAFNRSQHR